jgi:hypothetical protein
MELVIRRQLDSASRAESTIFARMNESSTECCLQVLGLDSTPGITHVTPSFETNNTSTLKGNLLRSLG